MNDGVGVKGGTLTASGHADIDFRFAGVTGPSGFLKVPVS
jgi:hypothetical protein